MPIFNERDEGYGPTLTQFTYGHYTFHGHYFTIQDTASRCRTLRTAGHYLYNYGHHQVTDANLRLTDITETM
ncbi:hypothetical protein M413DRAFT_444637 [Hebeloma cylindrosporum]|uniref:Uncharacterized protein n=1 Tax=Hebeloma cylindrosporum TaxID=76867 RepID=A0A0C3CD76_HEBCY|nr:hypothetical protein M413DRAFT_444637 [Hebeloma cylindrosporum h7]